MLTAIIETFALALFVNMANLTLLQNAVSHATRTTSYVDNTQVYLSTPACDHIDAMERLANCVERIRGWMANSHLKLNEEKTQIIWLGTRQQLNKLSTQASTLPNATVQFSTAVKDLGVVLDSQLTLANHVAALIRSCFLSKSSN